MQIIYYIMVTILALLLLYNLTKKRSLKELVCIAILLVTFALRALHIK